MNYETIYKVNFFNLPIITYLICFILVIMIILIKSKRLRLKKLRSIIAFYGIIFFASFLVFVSCFNHYSLLNRLESEEYLVVEGVVRDFISGSSNTQGNESFYINDIKFHYSYFHVTGGFNRSNAVGGKIHEGMELRISYIGGIIIRIEEKNERAKL